MEAVAINGHDTVEFHEETGEIFESPAPLSGLASQGISKPDYWRNAHNDSLISNVGPEFMAAFMAVQQEIGGIMENDADGYGYKYTSLAAVIARVLKAMHKNGLVLQQYAGKIHGLSGSSKALICEMHTKITHAETNQNQITITPIPMEPISYAEKDANGKKTGKTVYTDIVDPQSYGKASTYSRRYTLLSYWGIAPADNEAFKRLEDEQTKDDLEAAAEPIINGFKSCKSKQELVNWTKANQDMMSMLPVKVFQIVKPEYVEFKKGLPEIAPEDESQENQLDLEDAINGKGEAA